IQVQAQHLANVRVLNNSWENAPDSMSLEDELKLTASNNILFVAIAGNASPGNVGANIDSPAFYNYPGSYSSQKNIPNVITVANTDVNDNLASSSNYGPVS